MDDTTYDYWRQVEKLKRARSALATALVNLKDAWKYDQENGTDAGTEYDELYEQVRASKNAVSGFIDAVATLARQA